MDFNGPIPQIVIPAGSITGTATVVAVADALDEFDETVTITIPPGNITNAVQAAGNRTVTYPSTNVPVVINDQSTVTSTIDVPSDGTVVDVNVSLDITHTDGRDVTAVLIAPDGTRIGHIVLPEICSNVCFGGKKRNRLFMTASRSVYAVYVETQGAHIT